MISRETFDKIRGEEPLTELEPYNGGTLRSASGPIEVCGTVQLRQCMMSEEQQASQPKIIVVKELANHDCLVGRDLMQQVPVLRDHLEQLRSTVQDMSTSVERKYARMPSIAEIDPETSTTAEETDASTTESESDDSSADGFETCSEDDATTPSESEAEEAAQSTTLHQALRQTKRRLAAKRRQQALPGNIPPTVITDSLPLHHTTQQPAATPSNEVPSACLEVVPNALDAMTVEHQSLDESVSEAEGESDSTDERDATTSQSQEPSNTELEQVQRRLRARLQECSSESLLDLKPLANTKVSFVIQLQDPKQQPITCKSRPLPHHLKEKVRATINEQLQAGIIRPSFSAWSSALRVVHKPDGSIRITVDYKPLNKAIVVPQYPLPSVADMYNKLANARFYSKIDLKAAYHQIPMHPDSIQYTAFICEFGLFEYLSMPMGISSAPGWFQRFIEEMLHQFIVAKSLSVYLDDIILHSADLEEHEQLANAVIDTIKQRKAVTSLKKSELAVQEVLFLGNVIQNGRIKPHAKRMDCLRQMKQPTTIFELQRILGVMNYSRLFIPNYAELSRPLYALMNLKDAPDSVRKRNGAVDGKKVTIEWTPDTLRSFNQLIEILCSDLVLALPDFDQPFVLTTDACDYGYGAVLEQLREEQVRIIAYYSKSYTAAQRNYPTPEKELLAVVMSIEHFHTYLYGAPFTVYTDHMPLTFVPEKRNTHQRMERWMLRLSLYQFNIKYKAGKDNIVADALSRLPDENAVNDNSEDEYEDVLIATIDNDESSPQSDATQPTANITPPSNSTPTQPLNHALIANDPSSHETGLYETHLLAQAADEDIIWLVRLIQTHHDARPQHQEFANVNQRILLKEYESFQLIDGLLYRKSEDRAGFSRLQFVLPSASVATVLDKVHTTQYSGHLGQRKTFRKISERFYRPNLRQAVVDYVRTCDVCQKVKASNHVHIAPLNYLLPSRTNQLVATDFAGPFKLTARGNRYVILITDCFGKTLQCQALPSKEATVAATAIIEHWCCIYGIPEQVLSDKGKEYRSCIWDAVCHLLDVERLNTTPMHPQCDGQSEKNVQQIKKMIRAHTDSNQETWDLGLAQLTFAYNSSVHETIGLSPFEVMFGRQPRIPIDLAYPNTIDMTRKPILDARTIQVDEVREQLTEVQPEVQEFDRLADATDQATPHHVQAFVTELKQRLETSFAWLESNKISRMERAKVDYDRRIRKRSYEVGEWVLCNHPKIKKGLSRGLAPRYHGPFVIVGKYANGCDYLIRQTNRPRARVKQIHQNNLRVYFRRGHPDDNAATIEEAEGPESQQAPLARPYNKNPLNPRWQRRTRHASPQNTSKTSSGNTSADESSSSSEPETAIPPPQQMPKRRVGRPRKVHHPTVVTVPATSVTTATNPSPPQFQTNNAAQPNESDPHATIADPNRVPLAPANVRRSVRLAMRNA